MSFRGRGGGRGGRGGRGGGGRGGGRGRGRGGDFSIVSNIKQMNVYEFFSIFFQILFFFCDRRRLWIRSTNKSQR